jgi:hypothetical protein
VASILVSILRVLFITAILAASFAIALFAGLGVARAGLLGTCQDGTCELVAAVYVMPFGGMTLYFATLAALSVWSEKRARRATAASAGEPGRG